MPFDFAQLDFMLEAGTLMFSFAAYPMLQLGIAEGFKKMEELEKAEAKKGGKKGKDEEED